MREGPWHGQGSTTGLKRPTGAAGVHSTANKVAIAVKAAISACSTVYQTFDIMKKIYRVKHICG